MNFEKARAHLDSLSFKGIKLGLANTSALLKELGDPHKKFVSVHVGGTNGKGSTSAMIAAILANSGVKCGLYTSPHLETFRERINVNGAIIGKAKAAKLVERVKEAVKKTGVPVTYFEFVTAMAFLHFAEEGAQAVAVEVGMGGRFDSTNVVTPAVSVITSIAMDHREHLGSTLRKIAFEKCGIIKKGRPVVTAVNAPSAIEEIVKTAGERSAPLSVSGEDFKCRRLKSVEDGERFDFESGSARYDGLRVSLVGRQQVSNAGMAIKTALILRDNGFEGITENSIRSALAGVFLPGRFEMARKNPPLIYDGAHNPKACSALCRALIERFGHSRVDFIFGAMGDKDYAKMILNLLPSARSFTFFSPSVPRAVTPDVFAETLTGVKIPRKVARRLEEITRIINSAPRNSVTCVTG
ncbi:MAG: bifunctional folylpolyglutamate synthase/dihydrofolate synthase, partial [Nitrospinae bacterium]|nr:bifunctional folylpolyglutamate synthase/dihydrofolate synthase [Nitrospinota bacterium]